MHRFIMTTLTLGIIIFGSTLALAAVDAPADMRISPPKTMKASKALVDFSHTKHGAAKIDCVTCHHTWDGKSDVQSCSIAGCHDQTGKKETNAFYFAFHNKMSEASCLGCHKSVKKQGNEVVPTSCKACHAK